MLLTPYLSYSFYIIFSVLPILDFNPQLNVGDECSYAGWKIPSTALLDKVFSSRLAHTIANTKTDRSEKSFRWLVVESLATEVAPYKDLNRFPTDVNDLVDIIGPLLTKRFKKRIVANSRDFDKLCGATISDGLIRNLSCAAWLEFLAVTLRYLPSTHVTEPSQKDLSTFNEVHSSEQFSIIQVNLKDSTILEVWKRNKTIINAETKFTLSDIKSRQVCFKFGGLTSTVKNKKQAKESG